MERGEVPKDIVAMIGNTMIEYEWGEVCRKGWVVCNK